MKENIELIEKFLIVVTLIVGIIVSANKGVEYISAKSAIVSAKAAQEQETANAQQLLTKTYTKLLTNLDADLRELDVKLDKEVWEGTVGWDKLIIIRAEKVKDRNQLLLILGKQVVSFKGFVALPTANRDRKLLK